MSILNDLSKALSTSKLCAEAKCQIVDDMLVACQSINLASAALRIDAFLRSPMAQENFAAVTSAIEMAACGAFYVATSGKVQLLKMEGWTVKMEGGKPVIRDGKVMMENLGCMEIAASQKAKIDQTVFEISEGQNGKVTMKFRRPLEIAAHPADMLVTDVSLRTEKYAENCSNCVKALLTSLVHKSGIVKLASEGKLMAPKPRDMTKTVTEWDQTGQPFNAEALKEWKIAGATPEAGIYRCETYPADRVGGGQGAHTFIMVVPEGGANPYFLCGTSGRRMPIDAYGYRVKIGRVHNLENEPIPPSRLLPGG